MRKSYKTRLISLSVIGTVFMGGALTLHNRTFHHYLLSLIQRGARWEISMADSRIRILRGIIEVEGLEIKDPRGKFRLTADHLRINLSSLSLIRGKVIVSDLEIQHPFLSLAKREVPSKPTPDVIRAIFSRLEKSTLLSNMILDQIVVTDLSIVPEGGKPVFLAKGLLHIEPTLLKEIEIGATLEDASGLIPSLRRLRLSAVAKKDGIKLKKLEVEAEKVQLTLEGEWKGDLERGSIAFKGSLQTPSVLSDPLTFDLVSSISQKQAEIKKIEAHLANASLEGKGKADLDRLTYDLTFTAKDLPLESLFQKMPSVVLGPAKGVAEVEGHASGRLPALEVSANAIIREFRHGLLAARQAHGTLQLDWPGLDFDALVEPGEPGRTEAHVKGGILFKHLPGKEKLQAVCQSIDVTFEKAALQDLLPTAKISGQLDGALRLEGAGGTSVKGTGQAKVTQGRWVFGPVDSLTTEVIFRPEGKITFQKTSLEIPNLGLIDWPGAITLQTEEPVILFSGEPAAGLTFKGNYQKESGQFRIDSLRVRRDSGSLDGSLNLPPGGKGEARLKGTFNLDWVRFFPSIFRDGRGLADLNLIATGSVETPTIRGEIEFLEDELEIRGFPQVISDLEGNLKIEGPTVFPKLTGLLGDGNFRLEGTIRFAKTKPEDYDLTFRGDNLTLSRPNLYRIDFDTDVSLKGHVPSPRLAGRIDIVDGRYVKPFVVRELVMKPFELEAEPVPWERALQDLQLNLDVKNSGDLKVENNVASLLLRSDLHVEGTYGHPRITGALTATEGIFHYFGEDFFLNEGRLEFVDPSRKEPYLVLTAQQEIPPQQPEYTVFVEVKGYLSNLEVSLSSSPSLRREDILSLITAGMTQEEIRQSGRSRRSVSAEILAGEISGVLGRPIHRSTGLDIFRLEASESGTLSRLSVGKYITDRLSLELTNDLDPETAERTFQANYYLTDNILLKGFRTRTAGTTPRYQFNMSFRFRLY